MQPLKKQMIDARSAELYRAHNGHRLAALNVRNAGNGVLRIDRPVQDVSLSDITVQKGYRVFETFAAKDQTDASVTGLLIENITATGLERGFARIGYNSSKGTIRNVRAEGTVHNDKIPCGIAFMDQAHNFSIEQCVMRGFRMEFADDRYWNGDGYSAERGNYGLRFLKCEAWDCTDGGFDLKSTGTFLDGCIAGQNKYNYRFWSGVEAHQIASLHPRPGRTRPEHGHFSIAAKDAKGGFTLLIGHLTARATSQAPLFTIHDGHAKIIIKSHDLQLPRGTPIVKGPGTAEISWLSGRPMI